MLLTISTTVDQASDLGYLLHKHPDRFQSFSLSFGKAHVFYPVANNNLCSACLLLDVDPIGLVRDKHLTESFSLGHYVNDRPYVCSSFMSVAIAQVFGSAMAGRCNDRPELVSQQMDLTAKLDVLPVRNGLQWLHRIFEPLGYSVEAQGYTLDNQFPEWGNSDYFSVTISGKKTLAELLTHLYVLIPVFNNEKHYFVGEDELEKLVAKGSHWLAVHPEKEFIARRYLRHRSSLYRPALTRLLEVQETVLDGDSIQADDIVEEPSPQVLRLNDQRHQAVFEAIRASGARKIVDLGCGEGRFLKALLVERQFELVLGMDVSMRSLELAQKRLKLDKLSERQAERISLIHGSLTYRDKRLQGFDAAAVIEVIEHLDPPRLAAFERVVFEFARPGMIVITTPNSEYNSVWETLPAGEFRHSDHRFEWTRQEFADWATRVSDRFGYSVRYLPVGPVHDQFGAPTQMAVFELN